MPCYTDPHSYCKHEDSERARHLCNMVNSAEKLDEENKKIIENLQDKLNFYQKNSDKVTDMLCRLLSGENYGVIEIRIPDDILEWWEKHKEWDKNRKDKK